MNKKIISLILILLFFLSSLSGIVIGNKIENKKDIRQEKKDNLVKIQDNINSEIKISNYKPGFIYFSKNDPIKLPLISEKSNLCVVLNYNLKIDTNALNVHHTKFTAKRILFGWETIKWDYQQFDGFYQVFETAKTGFYKITVKGYNEEEEKLVEDSIKILFLKIGQRDFGIKLNTRYDGVERSSSLLDLGIEEFISMMNTGKSKRYKTTIQNKDDTDIELRFMRKNILEDTIKVIETKLDVDTNCDTSKDYSVSLDINFPFNILNNKEVIEEKPSSFKTSIGYHAFSNQNPSNNKVNSVFCFGREKLNDPIVFKMSFKPNNTDNDSKISFFNSYETIDKTGKSVFYRDFNIDFNPATELTITTIPSEAKVSYDFGESSGKKTSVSFRAGGGFLNDIIQKYIIDPLPSFMSFDLTLLNKKEFIYESDSSYDVDYLLESIQNGQIASFKVSDLPKKVHASWGLDKGFIGDLSFSGFADINMSDDVDSLSLYLDETDQPLIKLENIPKKINFNTNIDLINHVGNFSISRDICIPRTIKADINFNNFVVSNQINLKNKLIKISWNIDRNKKIGNINCFRDNSLGFSTISTSIKTGNIELIEKLDLRNEITDIYWNLPDQNNNKASINLTTSGNQLFTNTLSLYDDSVELLNLSLGLATNDHFGVSWEKINNKINNFDWSGKILKLDNMKIKVKHPDNIFDISADLKFGNKGFFDLQVNRESNIILSNLKNSFFKTDGDILINPNRHLNLSWDLDESGEFNFYTYNQPIGDNFDLTFSFDPLFSENYRYGFRLSGDNFIELTRTIKWYADGGELKRIWILGDENWIPGDWNLEVLWNYEYYSVPWP